VVLPVIQLGMEMGPGTGRVLHSSGSEHALLTLPSIWAEYMILGWAALAGVGLLRIVASLWQIRRLRRGCEAIDSRVLGPELQATVKEFGKRRAVSVLVSSTLEVPTAIGFFRPAIVIPSWLSDGGHAEELKYVLLHELAHLQRWDDWTNLAQKLVKAMLFFHPGVWWIERKLSLDREMACDDAVLAQIDTPRVYALCLARVAERGFLRRQMALAQAAVDRVRQLTQRVTRILDGNRPRSTQLWKPALPMVAAIALLCAVSTSRTPRLVSLHDDQLATIGSMPSAPDLRHSGIGPVVNRIPAATPDKYAAPLVKMAKFDTTREAAETPTRRRSANPRSQSGRRAFVPAHYAAPLISEKRGAEFSTGTMRPVNLFADAEDQGDRRGQTQQYGVVLLVMTSERISSTGSVAWQVNMWEVRLTAPISHPAKPIPSKT
jgi:beta-lactamase regulating signal transducer with metallopeptidase domain